MSTDYVVAMAWIALYVYGCWPEEREGELAAALHQIVEYTPEDYDWIISTYPKRYG